MNKYDVWLVNKFYGTGKIKCAPIRACSGSSALRIAELIYQPDTCQIVLVSDAEPLVVKETSHGLRLGKDTSQQS